MRNPLPAELGTVIDDTPPCSVRPPHPTPSPGSRFTGARFRPTAPAPPVAPDSRYLGALWAAAEFDD